jgi:hypothetical protein
MMEENSNDQHRKFFAFTKLNMYIMNSAFDGCVTQRIALQKGWAQQAHVY